MSKELDPSRILEVGLGFWQSRTLLSAVELGIFTLLGNKSMRCKNIGKEIGLNPRGIWDFLDGLVALGFLEREGDGINGKYSWTLPRI
jgi:hypothetical protein